MERLIGLRVRHYLLFTSYLGWLSLFSLVKHVKKKPVDIVIIAWALIVCIIGIIYLILLFTGLAFKEETALTPKANITIIPAVLVPTIDSNFLIISPTPTQSADQAVSDQIILEYYVQITGTGGNGLRLRANPGTDADVNFIAAELEVFKVIGGPIQTGDYIWWQLIAPYDANRQGWAASEFLGVIEQ